jgi:hypothetical protein
MNNNQVKNFVSLNMEYMKHTNAIGNDKHVKRKIKNDENVYQELSKDNFSYIYKEYKNAYNDHEKSIGKKIAKNANTMIDCVVSFSNDQFEELKLNNDNYKNAIIGHLRLLSDKIKEDFGFDPLSIDMHMDEGTPQKDGSIKNNYHAHLTFYNYDHINKCQPLRKFKNNKKPFRKLQTDAGSIFEALGFQRGISKRITKAEHKKKNDYVNDIMEKKEEEILNIEDTINNLNYSNKIRNDEYKNMIERRDLKIQHLKDNHFLNDEKNSFKSIVDLVDSNNAKRIYEIFNAFENNVITKPLYVFGNNFLNKIKPLYNTLHWVFLEKPSKFEIEDKKRLEKLITDTQEISKVNSAKMKRLKRSMRPKPTLKP